MAGLEYSDAALNIKSAFYGVQKMVYVEGDDDVIFWECVFRFFDKQGLKVESLGGVCEVKKMSDRIAAHGLNSAVARDSDFTSLDNNFVLGPNIILTYGHSIENSLITPTSLHRLAKTYGRVPDGVLDEEIFDAWIDYIESSFADLVYFDGANDLGGFGETVLSNNCSRFMTSKSSCSPCNARITDYLNSITNEHLIKELPTVKLKIRTLPRRIIDFMRGHFLASAAMKKINRVLHIVGSSKSVNNDSFTSSLMMAFELCFDSKHPHFEHYQAQVALI